MRFSSIQPIFRTLSGATTPSQGGPGSYGNEGIHRIPQNSCITEPHHQIVLESYPGHWLEVGVLSLCSEAVGVFYCPSQLGKKILRLSNI